MRRLAFPIETADRVVTAEHAVRTAFLALVVRTGDDGRSLIRSKIWTPSISEALLVQPGCHLVMAVKTEMCGVSVAEASGVAQASGSGHLREQRLG